MKVIKANLFVFKEMLGLKVNFHKSRLVGININRNWMKAETAILRCEIRYIYFNYLSLEIGANPRRKILWQPVIKTVRDR